MSERSSNTSGEEGQITIFLALIFFLMLGISFLVFGGMREYFKASLTTEIFDLAGEDVLSQYDRPLSERYHIFLMDPREEAFLEEDGKGSVEDSFECSGFFRGVDCKITLDSSKKALDDDGKEILRQIKEWETYQGVKNIPEALNRIVKTTDKDNELNQNFCADDENSSASKEDKKDQEKEDTEEENPEVTQEERKAKRTWKEWKEVLTDVLNSGILLYVVDDKESLSALQLSSSGNLPSGGSDSISFFNSDGLSLVRIAQLKKLCQSGILKNVDSSLLTSDAYLIPYILEYFTDYRNKDTSKEHCLNYEVEYMLGGKKTDKANLKCVADQMFLLRFIVNYSYAVTDSRIKLEADGMATALSGLFGFPEAEKAVSLLLIASLCYGESLMEVRALFAGKKVALVKNESNWNLSFENAATKLMERADIKEVSGGVTYEEYLAVLLVIKSGSKKLIHRMMDVMQCNVSLEEPDFLLKNCIYSFQWTGTFSWNPFIRNIIAFGISQDHPYSMTISRTVFYN